MKEKAFRYRTIDIASITRDVLRQWWAILLFSVSIGLIVNTIANYFYNPVYSTSATFVVSSRGTNSSIYQDITNASDTAERFKVVLDSNILKREIAKDLGVASYGARTDVELLSETNLIKLTVRYPSAMMAYRYINSIMRNYSIISNYVIKNVVLDVIQQPTIPVTPSNANNAGLYTQIGLLVGFMIAVLYVAFFSYLKDTVKNANEASSKLAARFLGSIYHESRRSERNRTKTESMLITNPILSFKYTESCRMVASRIRSRLDRKKAKVVLVTSVAENEGKSTVASNTALALAQEGKKVLLIDTDFRKPSLYKVFDIDKDEVPNFVDMLRSGKGLNRSIIKLKKYPLFFILNNTNTGTIDDILANDRFETLLRFVRTQCDYIILDTAPMGLVPDAEGISGLCDASIIVVREDTILARNINDAIDTLNETNAKVLGIVFNDATGKSSGLSGKSGYSFGYKK